MKSFKVLCSLVVLCVVVLSASAEEKVKVEVQDNPKKSAILNADVIVPDVKKPTDVEITTLKSVIIDALIKTNDSLATVTVPTLVVETTTEDEDDDDDDYGQPEVDSGISAACIASLAGCGRK